MYHDYFGLNEAPFSIAPNPRYLYMSDRHREALAHLLYGIRSDGGFILLTGEVGTGKTTVCRCLLEQIPDKVDIAFVLNPKLTAVELLATACDDLGIEYPQGASIKIMVDRLNEFLLGAHQNGRRTVLIIDEAQNLSVDVLEQLRLLTNLETNEVKLLQIILLGQPELVELLAQKELRQLSQRVTARFHLEPLNRNEVHEYIKHRLNVAGARGTFFPKASINRIFKLSGGIPRVINLICDRSLLGAYSTSKSQVSTGIVNKAVQEIQGQVKRPSFMGLPSVSIAAGLLVISAIPVLYFLSLKSNESDIAAPGLEIIKAASKPGAITPVGLPMIANISPVIEYLPATKRTDLDEISEVLGHQGVGQALADLLVLWGVVFENQVTHPCTLASSIDLKCFTHIGSLTDVAKLNRPAVLSIGGQWLTLSSLEEGVATLIKGDRLFEISARQLARNWNGKYTIFWRTPPDYQQPLALGDAGVPVDWLANQLALIESSPPVLSIDNEFGVELEDQLKQFQLSVSIVPDGVAGVRTWIQVNNILGVGIPVLKQDEG